MEEIQSVGVEFELTPEDWEAANAAHLATLHVAMAPGEHTHHFLIERLLGAGVRIAAFTPREVRLEDAFLKLTTGALQ
jgi:hypothetical protein